MLLGLVRVVPRELRVDTAVVAALEADRVRTHDALQRVQDRARAETLERVAPLEPLAEIDGIVVAVGVPEPHQQAPGDVAPEGVDQLLAQQPHRRRAENHHALLVQPDDAEVRTEVQEFGQLQPLELRVRWLHHGC